MLHNIFARSERTIQFLITVLFLSSRISGAIAQETSVTQVQGLQDSFVLSLAEDHLQRLWIGGEEQGIWCLDEAPGRPRWTQYTRPNGLGDESIYALACDQQGRIWAGHLNHGVSVFDGPAMAQLPGGRRPHR